MAEHRRGFRGAIRRARRSDGSVARLRPRRLPVYFLAVLFLLAGFDALLLHGYNLNVISYAGDKLGLSPTRFDGSFESGKINCRWCRPDGWVIQRRVDQPDAMVVGEDFPTRDGSYALRIHAEQDWSWDPKPRIELSSHDQPFFEIGEEYWVGWSIYLPDDGGYEFDSQQAEVLLQVHGLNDDCDAGGMGPPHALRPIDGRWRWDVRWDPTRCMGSIALGREVIDIGPQERGKWTDFVARFVFSHESDGVTQVWLDGVLVVDRVGMPNHYNSASGPYLKIGFYKSGWLNEPSDVTTRTIYIDAVRVYEGADAYARVDSANPVTYDGTARGLAPIVAGILLAAALVVLIDRRRRARLRQDDDGALAPPTDDDLASRVDIER